MGLRNVVFRDVYPWERVPDLLSAADIHLVVQKREASGLVMPSKTTNILASGRPMLATADPGTALHSLVQESGAGYIAEPDDAPALVRCLKSVAADRQKLTEAGMNARAYAVRELGMDAILSASSHTWSGWVRRREGHKTHARPPGLALSTARRNVTAPVLHPTYSWPRSLNATAHLVAARLRSRSAPRARHPSPDSCAACRTARFAASGGR